MERPEFEIQVHVLVVDGAPPWDLFPQMWMCTAQRRAVDLILGLLE